MPDKDAPACRLVLCEDPKTGDIVARPEGKCPAGYVEKFAQKVTEMGLTFIVPKKVEKREER